MNRRGCVWWVGIVLFGLAGFLVAASWAGARAGMVLREKYPPVGQMVDIGGYRLHLDCQGQGEPTVILEATIGTPGSMWALIQPEVARHTRACAYDRAGIGWSDPSPRPRTIDVIAEELHTLLDRAGIRGSKVLVGNSAAGWMVRYYAHNYPDAVAGIVLVDSAHEDQFQRVPGEVSPAVGFFFDLLPVVFKTRIPALMPALIPVYGKNELPETVVDAYQAQMASEMVFSETMSVEIKGVQENLAQVRAARITSLGDMPLIVLTHGRLDAIPGVTTSEEAVQQVEKVWQDLQRELAALSPKGQLLVAEGIGHNIQFENPDLVIDAILEVVEAVRQGD